MGQKWGAHSPVRNGSDFLSNHSWSKSFYPFFISILYLILFHDIRLYFKNPHKMVCWIHTYIFHSFHGLMGFVWKPATVPAKLLRFFLLISLFPCFFWAVNDVNLSLSEPYPLPIQHRDLENHHVSSPNHPNSVMFIHFRHVSIISHNHQLHQDARTS